MNARERKAEAVKIARNRDRTEVRSYAGAAVEVICSAGHPEMRSRTNYDGKGRVTSVVWTCQHEGCDRTYTVDPKKRRNP